uniref:Cyclin-F n=1 Tax=Denticeps clupeoides TaxID=299321 RepID=A0AAY4AV68_9TELE
YEAVHHCRCSKCFSLPTRKRVKKRTPTLTLLSLPEEVVVCVLKWLSAEDLLSVRAVHSQLRDLVDSRPSVWARVSFRDRWPSPDSIWLFERAAERGNFEAAVKLGIAYLYNEGPSLSDEGRADVCGRQASRFFSLAESARPPTADPFMWLFIRPPWSPSGGCCKAVVYEQLRAECDANTERKGALLHCLARVLHLFDEEEKRAEAMEMLEASALSGSVQSSYLLWEHKLRGTADPGRYLQCIRTLRDYAAKGCWQAQLTLAKACVSGNPLGLVPRVCADLVAQLFRSCPSPWTCPEDLVRRGLNDTMRYILVDWLVEVATMKDFSSLTLHVTVACVDRYLAQRAVPKARLQLLGIACMVVCTRYMSKDILTIREAVWLTDNTYQYEDLVRMMGEVIAVLGGKIHTPTLLDYTEVLRCVLPLERRSENLLSYVCELSLLYSALSVVPAPRLASAALLLIRALHRYVPLWPSQMEEYSGFGREELVPSAVKLYVKCFSQDVPRDYRHVSLTGVKQRFEDDVYNQISKDPVMGWAELCQVLEVSETQPQVEPLSPGAAETHTFLSSPHSHSKRRREDSMQAHRGSFLATPTAELSSQEETLLGDILDWSLDSSCSGYEGDQESEGEKETETSVVAVTLELEADPTERQLHCRALSSEDSFSEEECAAAKEGEAQTCSKKRHSSGYSSVQSSSPCLHPSPSPGFRLLLHPRGSAPRQVKRKNGSAHSGEEREREGGAFLRL